VRRGKQKWNRKIPRKKNSGKRNREKIPGINAAQEQRINHKLHKKKKREEVEDEDART